MLNGCWPHDLSTWSWVRDAIIIRELNHGGYKCPGNNLYRPPRQCSHQPARPAARPGPAPPHHRSTAVASHHTPTQTFWSLILYNVTHKNNTYKGMSHNGDKYYNLTMIEPNIGSCNLVILPQGWILQSCNLATRSDLAILWSCYRIGSCNLATRSDLAILLQDQILQSCDHATRSDFAIL